MHKDLPVQHGRGVVFILRRPNNTFLMQLRDKHSPRFANMWCFPGGRCNEGEDYLDTVVREIKEEAALTVNHEVCKLILRRLDDKNHVYLVDIAPDLEPKLLEGADLQWMNINQIKQLELGFWQEDIIPALEAYLQNTSPVN